MNAPTLDDIRGVHKITLPDYPESEVEIYDDLLFQDSHLIETLSKDTSNKTAVVNVLTKIIKGWNFTDKEKNPLPVTEENLNKLSLKALGFLAVSIVDVIKKTHGDKKKDIDTSQA